MKVTVKIDERFFEVEVVNLHTQPVIAIVDGEQFEVWPKDLVDIPVSAVSAPAPKPAPVSAPIHHDTAKDVKAVYAPIPGVIISITAQPGDVVEVGQELCVLEAMKMKNSIRSPRAGEIATVNMAAGDHVKHHDLLFEFAN